MTFLDSNITVSARKGKYVAGLCEYVRDGFVFNYTNINMQVSSLGNASCFAMYSESLPTGNFTTIEDSRVTLSVYSSSQEGYLFLRSFPNPEPNAIYSISVSIVKSNMILLSS